MPLRSALLAAILIGSHLLPALAQQDTTPVNADAILKELDAIEQKQKKLMTDTRNAILGQLKAASLNGGAAASFYTEAVENVQFEGTKGKGEAFTNWKKNNSELLRSKAMQTALVLYLRYAVLGMEWKETEDTSKLVPVVMQYLNDLIAAEPVLKDAPKEVNDLLKSPLNNSPIAKWLRLGEWLPGGKNFENSPGNVSGILDKNIRTALRESKDPKLIQTWDLEMKLQADRITEGRLDHQANEFNTVTRPKLVFQRAKDMVIVGQPNRSLTEIIGLIRSYPEHPDFNTWVAEVRSTVKKVAPAPAPEPAAAQATATPQTSLQ